MVLIAIRLALALGLLITPALIGQATAQTGSLGVTVTSEGTAVAGARVQVGDSRAETDASGTASLPLPRGRATLMVTRDGFLPASIDLPGAEAGDPLSVVVELQRQPEEYVTVSATRTDARIEDLPMRVEVLGADEIEEKMLMTPGDIVMMLNEMGGLRVQATSPSLGAASVRVQGMRGRYTRFLSDGLPLFGAQVGGLGLLQIPPADLAQVEVIKGVASSLYGAGAMGGVVNLVSRRPSAELSQNYLFNRSTRGATDAVAYLGGPLRGQWAGTLLGGGHWQDEHDADSDGWADLAGYARGEVRPRLFWDNHAGASLFLTAGATTESRHGGTVRGALLPTLGLPYRERLDTDRLDAGGSAQMLLGGATWLSVRASTTWQRHEHLFGIVAERDRHRSTFAEASVRRAVGRHLVVAGVAFEGDRFDAAELPRLSYAFTTPGVFAQDDVTLAPWLSVSASARADVHSKYGAFFSPRGSALVRWKGWSARASAGTGFFPATPLTEETEAAGLSGLAIAAPLRAETARSGSLDVTRGAGPFAFTVTLFESQVSSPLRVERDTAYTLGNEVEPTTNAGAEFLATWRHSPLSLTANYGYVRAREHEHGVAVDVPLTPRHAFGVVGMWERDGVGRVGLEFYYTGAQRLDANPFRDVSEPYAVCGVLVERVVGRLRFFVNGENLTGVRQSRFDPLVRPSPAGDGRWAVDAWSPLDGRTVNGGVRLRF